MPVALDELGTIMHKKKAFIVTDSFLYNNGYVKPIEAKLDEMGIKHTCFFEVAPIQHCSVQGRGAAQMTAFEPDTIIAVGGGSAMDAARSCGFSMSIRRQILRIWRWTLWISVNVSIHSRKWEEGILCGNSTSSGTGSEVTPLPSSRMLRRGKMAAGRLPASPEHGDCGCGQYDDAAEGADKCIRNRCYDACH